MDDRLFGLDMQLLFDVCIVFVFIMVLYIAMSQLFFKPVRAVLEQRKASALADKEAAQCDDKEAVKYKSEYERMRRAADKEAEVIMSVSYKNARKLQEKIISDAKVKARAIIEQADKDAEMEINRVKDEVKAEMAEIASTIAGHFADAKDPFREAMLLEETLEEMGGKIWQNS